MAEKFVIAFTLLIGAILPYVQSQGTNCTTSSILTVCLALPLHASTFSSSGDCTTLSSLISSQSGSGGFAWPPSSATTRNYSCATKPISTVSSSINSPDPFYFSCASGITSAAAYSRLMSQVWALGINSVFISNLIKSYTRNGVRSTATQLWVWFSCRGSPMPADPSAANAVGQWASLYYQAGSILSPPPPLIKSSSYAITPVSSLRSYQICGGGSANYISDGGQEWEWDDGNSLDIIAVNQIKKLNMTAVIMNPSNNDTLIYNEDAYVLWAPYLTPSFISGYMADGSSNSSVTSYIRSFVQAGGVFLVSAAMNTDQSPSSQVCSTPLALINGVLDEDTGCSCSSGAGKRQSASAILNSSAAMSVFGAAAAAPLIAAAGVDYKLSLSLVAASPLYCPPGGPAPAPFFDIYPVFDTTQYSSTVPLSSTALVKAWSLGSGWVIYVGAGILPEDRVFGRDPIDKQVWNQLLLSLSNIPSGEGIADSQPLQPSSFPTPDSQPPSSAILSPLNLSSSPVSSPQPRRQPAGRPLRTPLYLPPSPPLARPRHARHLK